MNPGFGLTLALPTTIEEVWRSVFVAKTVGKQETNTTCSFAIIAIDTWRSQHYTSHL
jgi:Sec-independent protein secretion pathway component TatC